MEVIWESIWESFGSQFGGHLGVIWGSFGSHLGALPAARIQEPEAGMMMMVITMGDKVPHFYIYQLPIVRFSGCYLVIIIIIIII